jgi:hypothetical protein
MGPVLRADCKRSSDRLARSGRSDEAPRYEQRHLLVPPRVVRLRLILHQGCVLRQRSTYTPKPAREAAKQPG